MTLVLRNARLWPDVAAEPHDVVVSRGRVVEITASGVAAKGEREADLAGRLLLPGLVNGHDHLDFSTFPPLGQPPYANVYEWAAQVDAGTGDPAVRRALAVPLADRLFLGGLRNLLAGVTAVAHHNPYHRSLGRADFPVRVLSRYGFAHSPGLTPHLRRTYRTTDRRVPWMVHAAEGTDPRCGGELDALIGANVLRQNTVIVHGIALPAERVHEIAAARACVVWCPESNRHLYQATAPVAALRAAGVRIGLGSDSPASGVRDALSNLAAARAENLLSDADLVGLATGDTAEVVRLPVGSFAAGSPADFLAVESLAGLLRGERAAVLLTVVAGRALYGEADLMKSLAANVVPAVVDGSRRVLLADVGRRSAGLLKSHPGLTAVRWLQGLRFE